MDKIVFKEENRKQLALWFLKLDKAKQDAFYDAMNKHNVALPMPFEEITFECIMQNRAKNEVAIQEEITNNIERYKNAHKQYDEKLLRKTIERILKQTVFIDLLVYKNGEFNMSTLDDTGKYNPTFSSFVWQKEELNYTKLCTRLLGTNGKDTTLSQRERMQNILLRFYLTIYYMTESKKVEEKVTQIQKVKKSKAKKGKKAQVRTVSVRQVIYTPVFTDDNRDDAANDSDEQREYNRQIESWGVRGHWRTYKNGKRVWIKPQVRGDKSKQVADKTYTIIKDKK